MKPHIARSTLLCQIVGKNSLSIARTNVAQEINNKDSELTKLAKRLNIIRLMKSWRLAEGDDPMIKAPLKTSLIHSIREILPEFSNKKLLAILLASVVCVSLVLWLCTWIAITLFR